MNKAKDNKINVIIVGYGFSGNRFLTCLNYLKKENSQINIVAIVDKNELLGDSLEIIPFYSNIDDAFENNKIDIVIVSTNDSTHEDIFDQLKKYDVDIITEKPLVSNYDICKKLEPLFQSRKIYINYIERLSPIVNDFKTFINENELKITKGTFFWGKNRYFDPRPTFGVYADITHPLDLVCYMLDFKNPNLSVKNYSRFNYATNDDNLVDSIDIILKENNIIIDGHSSFTWAKRKREITFYAESSNKDITFQINLNFDNPKWDTDEILINKVNMKNKSKVKVFNRKYESEITHSGLLEHNKMYYFVKQCIESIAYNKNNPNLANYNSAKLNMKLIQQLLNQTKENKLKSTLVNKFKLLRLKA